MIAAGLIGFLLGIIFCYYKQIKMVYQQKDLIGAGSDFITSGQNLYDHLRQSL